MMTRSSHERDLLSVVRMALSPIGKIIAVTFTMPVVKLFGNDQAAWIKTMSIWCAIALVLLVICFVRCKETVNFEAAQQEQPKVPASRALKALLGNPYFWATLVRVSDRHLRTYHHHRHRSAVLLQICSRQR